MLIRKYDYYTYFIYFYIFVTPWHFSKSQLSFLSLIAIVWTFVKYKKEVFYKLRQMSKFLPLLLLFLFFAYSYLSTLWSEPISRGLEHVNTFYKYYFVFIIIILVSLNKQKSTTAIKILVVSFGCYAIYSILIYMGVINFATYGFTSDNPTGHLRYLTATQYMVMAFFLSSIFVYYSSSIKQKTLFSFISLLSFIALFLNNSRTSQIAFFAILLIFMIILLKKYIFNFKAIILLLLVVFSSLYFLYQNNKISRFQLAYKEMMGVVNKAEYKGSFGVRLYFNKVGLELFKDNFLFGTGPKDNRIILQETQKKDPNYNVRIINHFHSEHLDTLTAYGLVGYLLLFSSIVILIYNLRKQPLYYYLSLSVFLCLFFNSFANKTLSVKPLNYVYIIFFLTFAIIALNKENTKKSKN